MKIILQWQRVESQRKSALKSLEYVTNRQSTLKLKRFFRAMLLVVAVTFYISYDYAQTLQDYMVFATDLHLEIFVPQTTSGWETYGRLPFSAYDNNLELEAGKG